jgi:6-phosphogluconolactonase
LVNVAKYKIQVFETTKALFDAAAVLFIDLVNQTIKERGQCVVALSGGNTPKQLYDLLASPRFNKKLNWHQVHFFWTDERCLPLNDEENNAHNARLILLNKIDIPESNIHIIPVNLLPEEAAEVYETSINVFFKDLMPQFDLTVLGLGEDGHTASLFPGTPVLKDQTMGIRSVYVEEQAMFRVTMTAPMINVSRNIIFLVSGQKKAPILKSIFYKAEPPEKYPAQLIKPTDGKLYWMIDKKAEAFVDF